MSPILSRNCIRTLVCIDGLCFDNTPDAVKYLMKAASRRLPVTITRETDASTCIRP